MFDLNKYTLTTKIETQQIDTSLLSKEQTLNVKHYIKCFVKHIGKFFLSLIVFYTKCKSGLKEHAHSFTQKNGEFSLNGFLQSKIVTVKCKK